MVHSAAEPAVTGMAGWSTELAYDNERAVPFLTTGQAAGVAHGAAKPAATDIAGGSTELAKTGGFPTPPPTSEQAPGMVHGAAGPVATGMAGRSTEPGTDNYAYGYYAPGDEQAELDASMVHDAAELAGTSMAGRSTGLAGSPAAVGLAADPICCENVVDFVSVRVAHQSPVLCGICQDSATHVSYLDGDPLCDDCYVYEKELRLAALDDAYTTECAALAHPSASSPPLPPAIRHLLRTGHFTMVCKLEGRWAVLPWSGAATVGAAAPSLECTYCGDFATCFYDEDFLCSDCHHELG